MERRPPVAPLTVQFLLDGYVAAQAEVVDITTAGICVVSAENLGPDDGYEIRLAGEGGLIPRVEPTAARVVWCEPGAPGARRRVGLRFDHRRAETRLALERLIQAACPQPSGATDPAPERG